MRKIFQRKGPFQFLQFSMIGGLNALVDIGTLNVFLILYPTTDRLLLALYNTLAYTLAIINSYLWNSKLTFRQGSKDNLSQKTLFFLQALVSLGINTSAFLLGLYLLDWLPIKQFMVQNAAKGIAMVLSSTASFFFMKYFVFTRKANRMFRSAFLIILKKLTGNLL